MKSLSSQSPYPFHQCWKTGVTALVLIIAASTVLAEEQADPKAVGVPPTQRHDYSSGFGIGALIGEPTGLSLKAWLDDRSAIDAGVAWSFRRDDSFSAHADYLIHCWDLIPVSKGKLPLYFGVGGRVLLERGRDTRFGVRAPVGLSYMFENTPLELFVEVGPIFDVAPKTQFSLTGGIGVRYYFR
jgi:hypothetical protein